MTRRNESVPSRLPGSLLLALLLGLVCTALPGGRPAAEPAAPATQFLTGCYDVWPPYMQADGTGITADLVAAVVRQSGRPIVLRAMPWKRCLAAVERGTVTFALDATPRAGYQRSARPVTTIRTGVFALAGRFPTPQALRSLAEVRVGRPLGWSNWEMVAGLMPEGPVYTMVAAAGAEQMMDMLRHARIDLYVDDLLAGRRLARHHGLEVDVVMVPSTRTDLFALFGPDATDEKMRWDAAVDALKRSGWLDEHFRKAGML